MTSQPIIIEQIIVNNIQYDYVTNLIDLYKSLSIKFLQYGLRFHVALMRLALSLAVHHILTYLQH